MLPTHTVYNITTLCCTHTLTWWIALNDRMVVHLEGGIATAACEAYNMVLAVIHYGSRLIDGDVICSYIEYDTNFSLILHAKTTRNKKVTTSE